MSLSQVIILLIGGGGREKALMDKLRASSDVIVHVAPGLSGFLAWLSDDEKQRVFLHPEVKADDIKAILALAQEIKPDLIVFGPERPLIIGAANVLTDAGFRVFGFDKNEAQWEGNKSWAKARAIEVGHPTAPGTLVRNSNHGIDVLNRCRDKGRSVVLKDLRDRGGKGVIVIPEVNPDNPDDQNWDYWQNQREALLAMMDSRKPYGFQSKEILIEERYRQMREWSAISIIGKNGFYYPFMPVQDFKWFRRGNSGGMGIVAPAPGFSMADMAKREKIIQKIQAYMQKKYGKEMAGIFYAGLNRMNLIDYLVEVNCRGGDPETQVQLEYIIGVHLHELMLASLEGRPEVYKDLVVPEDLTVVGIVMASKGYPGDYSAQKGKEVLIPDPKEWPDGVKIIISGLAYEDGKFFINGSRCLMILATSRNKNKVAARAECRENALLLVEEIQHDGALDWNDQIGQEGYQAVA